MIVIQLQGVGATVQEGPGGGKILAFVDEQSAITVVCPLSPDAANALAGQLIGSPIAVAPASALPKVSALDANGRRRKGAWGGDV